MSARHGLLLSLLLVLASCDSALFQTDHGGVDDLPLARGLGLVERREHPEAQQHAPAAKIGHQVHGNGRRSARLPHGVKGARQGQVVDVVTGDLGQGALLAPAGDPSVDQGRVAGLADLGSQAQALHDPGPKSLDEDLSASDLLEGRCHALRRLQVQLDPLPIPKQKIVLPRHHGLEPAGPRALDAHDPRPHPSQHHPREGRRPEPSKLDNGDVRKRSTHGPHCSARIPIRESGLGNKKGPKKALT